MTQHSYETRSTVGLFSLREVTADDSGGWATGTEPTRAVEASGLPPGYIQLQGHKGIVRAIPYGAGANDRTFDMHLWGIEKMRHGKLSQIVGVKSAENTPDGALEIPTFVVRHLAGFACVLGSYAGPSAAAYGSEPFVPASTDLYADTLAATASAYLTHHLAVFNTSLAEYEPTNQPASFSLTNLGNLWGIGVTFDLDGGAGTAATKAGLMIELGSEGEG